MEKVVFGIDIMPYSSPSSSREAKYALVIVGRSGVLKEQVDVPLRRIIRYAWEYKPARIGIDNVFELGASEGEVARILSLLPPSTRVLQVTLTPEGYKSLKAIAKSFGIEVSGKPDPLKTAYLSAYLAERGVGVSVEAFEEKTRIFVVRSRRHEKGGMSQERYKRMSRGMVLRVVKKIKSILESEGIDYDMTVRRSEGGLERCIFTVYTSRDKLRGLVKQYRGRGVRVVIRPVYRGELTFKPTRKLGVPLKKLIIGLDPGIVTGLAAIDTYGNIVLLTSGKSLDRQEIIAKTLKFGKPIVVATDVNPPPSAVVKLAQSLGAQLYVPSETMSTVEKQSLVEKALTGKEELRVEDTHQRDALAAALKALNNYQSKLKQAETYIEKLDLDLDVDKIREAVIRGKSIAEAVEEEISKLLKVKGREAEVKVKESKPKVVNVDKYISKIRELERENLLLKNKVRELKREIEELKLQLELSKKIDQKEVKVKREIEVLGSEVKLLSENIRRLQEDLEDYKVRVKRLLEAMLKLEKRELKIALPLSSLTLDSISKATRSIGLNFRDRLVYVSNLTFAQEEALEKLRGGMALGIIVDYVSPSVKEWIEENYQIPVVETSSCKGIVKAEELLLYSLEVEEEIEGLREELVRRAEEKARIDIEELLEEYKRERWSS